MKKGDVLSVARIAGIQAAKRTAELVPLCHNIALSSVSIDLSVVGNSDDLDSEARNIAEGKEESLPWQGTGQGDAYSWHGKEGGQGNGRVDIEATVQCEGKTGVEMEALTAASVAALTVYDMCKAVDRGMRVEGLRVVRKEGGKSGRWVEGVSVDGVDNT